MPPEPRLRRHLLLLGAFAVGVSTGGCLAGVQAVGIPTPDASPDARRLEDKVMRVSGNLFVGGSIVSVAALVGRFLAGKNSKPLKNESPPPKGPPDDVHR